MPAAPASDTSKYNNSNRADGPSYGVVLSLLRPFLSVSRRPQALGLQHYDEYSDDLLYVNSHFPNFDNSPVRFLVKVADHHVERSLRSF